MWAAQLDFISKSRLITIPKDGSKYTECKEVKPTYSEITFSCSASNPARCPSAYKLDSEGDTVIIFEGGSDAAERGAFRMPSATSTAIYICKRMSTSDTYTHNRLTGGGYDMLVSEKSLLTRCLFLALCLTGNLMRGTRPRSQLMTPILHMCVRCMTRVVSSPCSQSCCMCCASYSVFKLLISCRTRYTS